MLVWNRSDNGGGIGVSGGLLLAAGEQRSQIESESEIIPFDEAVSSISRASEDPISRVSEGLSCVKALREVDRYPRGPKQLARR
jgi:hypothetical protein